MTEGQEALAEAARLERAALTRTEERPEWLDRVLAMEADWLAREAAQSTLNDLARAVRSGMSNEEIRDAWGVSDEQVRAVRKHVMASDVAA